MGSELGTGRGRWGESQRCSLGRLLRLVGKPGNPNGTQPQSSFGGTLKSAVRQFRGSRDRKLCIVLGPTWLVRTFVSKLQMREYPCQKVRSDSILSSCAAFDTCFLIMRPVKKQEDHPKCANLATLPQTSSRKLFQLASVNGTKSSKGVVGASVESQRFLRESPEPKGGGLNLQESHTKWLRRPLQATCPCCFRGPQNGSAVSGARLGILLEVIFKVHQIWNRIKYRSKGQHSPSSVGLVVGNNAC